MGTRISSKTSVVVAIIAAVLAILWAPAAASPDDITEYPLPTDWSVPEGIAAGPDGNMWFTGYGAIGRITPAGAITEYPLPHGSGPKGIAAGPDGSMWFTEVTEGYGKIGRITPTGVITEYPLPTKNWPEGIAAGPDGNLWFTESGKIGRITPDGVITEYPLPDGSSPPYRIAAGPDGNLWFTEGYGYSDRSAGRIGRITPAGVITEYPLPNPKSVPRGIATGPDGNLWFTEAAWRMVPDRAPVASGSAIGRITPAGVITEYPLPNPKSAPEGIAAGPDGNLWFTEGASAIGRITPAGTITEYPLPTYGSGPREIAAGPDGNLWFTEYGKIGRISPTATPTAVKWACPVNVTLHMPTPTTVGNRILIDRIFTNSPTCALPKPVVRCRPLASTTLGKKASCKTKATKRGKIRVNSKGYKAVRVTVTVRAIPKPAFAERWERDTWREAWILKGPGAAKQTGETNLTLSKGLVQSMDAADVDIKAIRGATLSKSGVVTFHVKRVNGGVITHKGALQFSSSTDSVTLQNIVLNYSTGKASASVQATAVPTVPAGIQITDLLTFTGGTNQIKRNGTWRRAEVALATSTSGGDPATLFAKQLGLPTGSIATGMTIGRANITMKK
jgi:virginiamycin B lyase